MVPDADYRELAVATPGWQNAPVPGWGINPLRAGPARVGVGLSGGISCEDDFLPHWAPLGRCGECGDDYLCGLGDVPGDKYNETSYGVVALSGAGGIMLGLLFGYSWWGLRKRTA